MGLSEEGFGSSRISSKKGHVQHSGRYLLLYRKGGGGPGRLTHDRGRSYYPDGCLASWVQLMNQPAIRRLSTCLGTGHL